MGAFHRSGSARLGGLLVVWLLGLCACASTQAPQSSALTGHWQLDAAASDQVAAKVGAAVTSAETRLRNRRRALGIPDNPASRRGPGGAQSGGSGEDQTFDTPGDLFGNGATIGPDFGELRMRLLQTLSSPVRLSIEVSAAQMRIQRDALPARDYQPGETLTRLNEYGTARLQARWSDGAFEIRERYTSGARLTESYRIDPYGDLEYTRQLVDPVVGALRLRSLYHRG